jgi:hypothetical protein
MPLPAALLAAAAAALCLCAAPAAVAQDDPVSQMLANQPPLTAEEVQQYIDFLNAVNAGETPVPPGSDTHRVGYIQTKMSAALQMAMNPALTADDIAMGYGSELAVPTSEEVELVRSRLADFPGMSAHAE